MNTPLTKVRGIGPSTVTILNENGINTAEDLATIDLNALMLVPGFSKIRAQQSIDSAQAVASLKTSTAEKKVADKETKKEKPVKAKKIKASKKDKKQEKKAKTKKTKTKNKPKKVKEDKNNKKVKKAKSKKKK